MDIDTRSGDVPEYKVNDKQYTLLMVNDVQGDSVYIRQNEFEINRQSGLRKIKEKGRAAYAKDLYAFTKKELKQMLKKNKYWI